MDEALIDLRRQNLFRDRSAPHRHDAAASFCSNDYLALAARQGPAEACGAGASRLVSGDWPVHLRLEQAAAELVQQSASLAFTSGYAANVGLLSALAGPDDLIVSDALNHASIIDGARLSRARVVVVPHLDSGAVSRALAGRRRGRALVVTESYFSMDADSPDLVGLRRLCDEHGAALVVDEAHALGVLGAEGRGICADRGVCADAVVGTFGKAFGAAGAFVAGCPALVAWLWNRARSFVFSTGLSPALAAAALDGMERARSEPARREQVSRMAARLREGLGALGAGLRGYGHVVPWVVGDPGAAMNLSAELRSLGVEVRAIRPPSVPVGTARLRLTVNAGHREGDVDRLLDAAASAVGTSRRRGDSREGRLGRGTGRVVIVAGTGTEIGKTHAAEALLLAWRRSRRVVGIKPIESGVREGTATDAERLAAASSFHVKQKGYAFSPALSPHLAARDDGVEIRPEAVAQLVRDAREQADEVVVELAGGLFSPISDGLFNADLAARLRPDAILLVAPDRLGVLHDVTATLRAAFATPLRITGVVLVTPEHPDASTGRNAGELARLTGVPVLAVLPRGTPSALAELPGVAQIVEAVAGRAQPSLSAG